MRRAIAKALTWRLIATCVTAGVTFGVTDHWVVAGTVAAIDGALKLVFYVIHEQVWEYDNLADRTTGLR